jgi:hypothetical protein
MIISRQSKPWRNSGTPYLRIKRDDACYSMARWYIVHAYRNLRKAQRVTPTGARDLVFDLVFGPSLLVENHHRGVTFHVPEEVST